MPKREYFKFYASFGTAGHSKNANFLFPKGISVSPDGKFLAVADSGNNRIVLLKIVFGGAASQSLSLVHEKVYGDIWPWKGSIFPKDPPDAYREPDNSDGLALPRALDGRAFHGGEGKIRPGEMVPMDRFNQPETLAWLSTQTLAIADTGNHRIKGLSTSGDVLWILGQEGWKSGYFHSPNGIDRDDDGNIYVTEARSKYIRGLGMDFLQRQRAQGNRLQIFNPDLTFQEHLGHMHHDSGRNNMQFKDLERICCFSGGGFLLTDSGNHRILVFDASRKVRKVLAKWPYYSLRYPRGVDADDEGRFLICDTGNHKILILENDGTVISQIIGKNGIQDAQFSYPHEARFAPKGYLFVLDTGNCRIQIFRGPYKEETPPIQASPSMPLTLPPDLPRNIPKESF
ncbi:MAG: hypothetical protein HQM10_19705 [Candidatus Riflebacteria bacterium]|nr:hypothetical protein [Candidatus Riflebacteria bacterium]